MSSFFDSIISGASDFLGGVSDYASDAGDYLFGSSSPTDNVSTLSSSGDYVPNEIPSFDSVLSGDSSFLPSSAPSSESRGGGSSFLGDIGGALLKPAVLGGVLQSGIGLVGGLQQIDAQKESRK
jgi:hypothetical protein